MSPHQDKRERQSPSLRERMAETPRPVARPTKGRISRSVRLAYLLILKELGELSEGQIRTLIQLQSKLREEEISRSEELYRKLRSSPRTFARSRKDLEEVRLSTPSTGSKSTRLLESRRIGVGYRDKGALRPSHRPREVSPRMFWSDDIGLFFRYYTKEVEPRWITSEELFEWRQRDFNLFDSLSEAVLRLKINQFESLAIRPTSKSLDEENPLST